MPEMMFFELFRFLIKTKLDVNFIQVGTQFFKILLRSEINFTDI